MFISDYLSDVFRHFRSYADENSYALCKLRDVTYQGGNQPDYEDKQVQELYILRFTFSYAFEYKTMYSEILSHYSDYRQLKILSFGCGPMTDYWSLTEALNLNDHGIDMDNTTYIGVDLIDWNHKFSNGFPVGYQFIKCGMTEFILNHNVSDTDIFFFPKSICEIDHIDQFCSALRSQRFSKNKITLGISLRIEEHHQSADDDYVEKVIDTVCANGYTVSNIILFSSSGNKGIRAYDRSFIYPDEILDYLAQLRDKCSESATCGWDCEDSLTRKPILTSSYINYKIIVLERNQT